MAVRDRISQLLFSRENGIGLHIYRYNIGGGSARAASRTHCAGPKCLKRRPGSMIFRAMPLPSI